MVLGGTEILKSSVFYARLNYYLKSAANFINKTSNYLQLTLKIIIMLAPRTAPDQYLQPDRTRVPLPIESRLHAEFSKFQKKKHYSKYSASVKVR